MTDARLDSAYGAVEDGGVRGEEARASPQRPHVRALVQALALLCVVSAGVSMNARTAVAPVLDKIVDDDDDRAAVHVAALTTRTLFLPTTDRGLDGFREIYSWNQGIQAPTVRVSVGTTVERTLTNFLLSETVTVHHHGVHMIATPYFDGASAITQSGVEPGHSMTYRFVAEPKGTHWYHSHIGAQIGDGLKGMFIVEDPHDPWKPFYSVDQELMFYEWYDAPAEEYWVEKSMAPSAPQDFPNGVVNGIVSRGAHGATAGFTFEVGHGRAARLRLCYGGINYKFRVEIPGFNLTVIAKDGTQVRPVNTRTIKIHAAERYDVIVETAHVAPGDYIINFDATSHDEIVDDTFRRPNWGHINATLRVRAAGDDALPVHADGKQRGAERALDVSGYPFIDSIDLSHDIDALRQTETPCPRDADRSIPFVITAGFPLLKSGGRLVRAPPSVSSTAFWRVNNNSWVDPSSPLYLTKGKCCVSTVPNFETKLEKVDLGEIIDVVVIQNGLGSEQEVHPLHLHGNKFWVVGSGPLPYPGHVEKVPNYNTVDPIYADTFPVVTGCAAPLPRAFEFVF